MQIQLPLAKTIFISEKIIKKSFVEFFLIFYFSRISHKLLKIFLLLNGKHSFKVRDYSVIDVLLANETFSLTLITNEVDNGSKIFS